MRTPTASLTIGDLAKAAAVGIETIRFYQRKGLMPEPEKPFGGIRRYGAGDVGRVRFIKSAQRLGFSLDEVTELLRLEDGTHCRDARQLAARKLQDIRIRLADLQQMETALVSLIALCGTTRGQVACPLIAALQQGEPTKHKP